MEEEILRRIAGASETLVERRATLPEREPADPEMLDHWAAAFAAGDRAALRRRLAWDGLEEEDALRALAPGGAARVPPPWTELLRRAMETAALLADSAPDDAEAREVPFGALLLPFLRASRPAPADVLAPPARSALERHLLGELSRVALPALMPLFSAFREERGGAAPGDALYRSFVSGFLGARLEPLLELYPVLGRLLCRVAGDGAAAADELARRLATDRAALASSFGAVLPVVAIGPGLSDRHHGGRTVALLTFANGVRLVYKPRSVAMEAAFAELLAEAAALGAPVPRGARVLAREGYGFMEAVTAEPLADGGEAETWSRRAGGLLCVAWLAGQKDLHMENLVAAREGPVVVDAEMAFQPARTSPAAAGALAGARAVLESSFASTGLLGALEAGPDGRLRDVGGISGTGGEAGGLREVVRDPNSDAMRLSEEPFRVAAHPNLPLYEGRRLRPRERTESLVSGFREAYRILSDGRERVAGRLAGLASHPVRILFRPSAQYARLLSVLLAPRYLEDGARRSLAMEVLHRPWRAEPERPLLWPLVAEERSALENLDLPHFTVPAGARTIRTASGEELPGILVASGLEAARARLERMGPEDLERQTEILRGMLSGGEEAPAEETVASGSPGPAAVTRSDGELIAAAGRIAAELLATALPGPGGARTWLAAGHLSGAEESARGASYYLYGGAAGIAVFLSAAARMTGRAELAEAARGAVVPLAAVLDAPELAQMVATEGIGGVAGLPSVALALAAAGRLAGDPFAVPLAAKAAALVTPEAVARDRVLDVEGGAAGAALALLALYEVTGDADLLSRAALCGDRLLETKTETAPGVWGWPDADGLLQAGFAHGSAGIALALGRLGAATERDDFLEGARAARRHAGELFDTERGSWPALARDGGAVRRIAMNGWCHGAPGIALSRLGLLEAGLADEELLGELAGALATTAEGGLLGLDHLCCGNAARIEALVAASERLGEPALRERAREIASAMLARAEAEGRFRFRRTAAENAAPHPGFFRGLAGIGMALLRVAAPEALPSLALLSALPYRAGADEAEEGERIARLDAGPAAAFSEMTFPAYRHLLSLRPVSLGREIGDPRVVTPLAVGALRAGRPVGLALAGMREGDATAEAFSLYVAPESRGEGLGTRLLEALERELAAEGMKGVHAVYMTGQPGQAALERVLEKSGWEPPVPRMLTARFSLEGARRTEWYGRYPLTEGYTVFPWAELTAEERAALKTSQEERAWIKPDLVPWKHDHYGFEPVSSLGVRLHGELVGWVINHALSPTLVRFTCSFIRRDLGRRGKLVPVFSESIRRLSERTAYQECTMTVPLLHSGMAGFLRRWCAPFCSFVAETRGTGKRLGP